MSHITNISCNVRFVNEKVIRECVQEVARENGGSVDTTYQDFYKNTHNADLVLKTRNFKRGLALQKIGAEVGKTEYVFKVDEYGQRDLVRSLVEQVKRSYVAKLAEQKLRAQGFTVRKKKVKDKIVIEAIR
ncbi:MAG: DUF1257 domain-containing protein [Candidatus Blackburnbacteria bacterium]|nr:DUF1257 domain-containing protein [Candidatus Blackburnbacteria bacterium]